MFFILCRFMWKSKTLSLSSFYYYWRLKLTLYNINYDLFSYKTLWSNVTVALNIPPWWKVTRSLSFGGHLLIDFKWQKNDDKNKGNRSRLTGNTGKPSGGLQRGNTWKKKGLIISCPFMPKCQAALSVAAGDFQLL